MSCSMFCKEFMGVSCDDVPEVTEENVHNDIHEEIDIQFENILKKM